MAACRSGIGRENKESDYLIVLEISLGVINYELVR